MDESSAFRFAGGEPLAGGGEPLAGDWEALVPPSAAEEKGRRWEMVSSSFDDCSIFPPKLHEGLHVRSDQALNLAPRPPPPKEPAIGSVIAPCFPAKEKVEEELDIVWRPVSDSAKRMIGSWFRLIRFKILVGVGGGAEAVGIGVFSIAALVGVAGVFIYFRRRHWREKEFLLFLLQEKDQKIRLLLHQVAELNAVLAAHRKVPVLRRT